MPGNGTISSMSLLRPTIAVVSTIGSRSRLARRTRAAALSRGGGSLRTARLSSVFAFTAPHLNVF
jgi:hypothetical protein